MSFLDGGSVSTGMAGLSLRLGWLLCGAMSLHTYSALVRSPERPILDPHPARPSALLSYLLLRTAREQAGLPLAAAVVTWPVLAAGHSEAWLLGVAVVAGGWLVGLLVGFPIHLASVWAAESPALAGVLEALRGDNPRLQAALIYAPGFVLALGGTAVYFSAEGMRLVLEGNSALAWLLGVPVVLGALAWLAVPALAHRYHFRTTLLLGEIDAMYAGLEDPEDAQWVYLQWTLRGIPGGLHPTLLRELRHGWRGVRGWITGAWGAGLLAGLVAWTDSPLGLARALGVGGAALVIFGGVALRLAVRDPLWLDTWLEVPARTRVLSRWIAVSGWLQGVVLPPVAALAIRQGLGPGLTLLGLLEGLALSLALGATLSSSWRARGWLAYLPAALLAWAGVVGGIAA